MEENYEKMKSTTLSTEEKKVCALVLSYYTGYKGNLIEVVEIQML